MVRTFISKSSHRDGLTHPDLAGASRSTQICTREIWIVFATVTQMERFGVHVPWVSTLLLRISPDRPGAHRNARATFGTVTFSATGIARRAVSC